MTPASRNPIESSPFYLPEEVDVVDVVGGRLLAWEAAPDDAEITFRGGDDLLPEFMALSTAEPSEMAAFLETYGVVEICRHGMPDMHPFIKRPKLRGSAPDPVIPPTYCQLLTDAGGRPAIAVDHLRRAALAFVGAQEAALALSARRIPESRSWEAMSRLRSYGRPMENDYRACRRQLAEWVTGMLSDCGVDVFADWAGERLNVTYKASGLLGTLTLLLAREIGQGETYTCDICGTPVDRVRPPKNDEGVYCDKPACRREQQRRNQAAWRARKREQTHGK